MENQIEWEELLKDLPLGSRFSDLRTESEDQSADTKADEWKDEDNLRLNFIKV